MVNPLKKEAFHRSDTAAMERALGYADKFTDKAGEYKVEKADSVEISEEGKTLQKGMADTYAAAYDGSEAGTAKEPATYKKTAEPGCQGQGTEIDIFC